MFILVIPVFVAFMIFINYDNFKGLVIKEMLTIKRHSEFDIEDRVVTMEDLDELPDPVKRYLIWTGIIGKPFIKSVRLKQRGEFRLAPDKPFQPLMAEEYYTTRRPSFLWRGVVKNGAFPVIGFDKYYNSIGNMKIRVLGLKTIADVTGDEINKSAAIRYLNEMVWFPTAFLEDYIQWEPLDDHAAKALFITDDFTVSAIFYFDDEGKVTSMRTEERYLTDGDTFMQYPWTTPYTAFKETNGIQVPVSGEAYWEMGEERFTYVRLDVTDLQYDFYEIYSKQ